MKKIKVPEVLFRTTFVAGVFTVLIAGLFLNRVYAEPPPAAPAQTNVVYVQAISTEPKPAQVKHQLTGAELYSINCNRCHQERYPTERTAAQWKTIMLHMQVRANVPGRQARLILQYLQENSGR